METISLLRNKEVEEKENSDIELINNNSNSYNTIDEPKQEVTMTMTFILNNLIPNIALGSVSFLMQVIQTHFLGQTKDLKLLNGIALGTTYNHLFNYIPFMGLSQAISVECSKTFGSKNLTLLGHQTNQVRIIIIICFIIYLILNLLFSNTILLLIAGEGKAYVDEAASYVIRTMPGLFFESQNSVYANFSEAHLHYTPIYIVLTMSVCIQFLSGYLLISVYNFGIAGAAFSYNITTFISLSIYILYYMLRNPFPESNFFCSKETFNLTTYKRMLSISFSTMSVFFAISGGSHILEVLCNKLPEFSYSKTVVLNSILTILAALSEAWMMTNSILIGNFIGENSYKKITLYIKYSFYLSLIIMIPIYVLFLIFRYSIAEFFSENEDLLKSQDINMLLIFVVFVQMAIFTQEFLIGIIRGCEMNLMANIVSCTVFLIFMPILASLLMFVFEMDVFGNLLAILIAFSIASIIWIIVFLNINFEQLCKEYQSNIENKKIGELKEENFGEEVNNQQNIHDKDNHTKIE